MNTADPAAVAETDAGGRQRLLRSAMRLFAERGFDGASISDITADAQVSRGLARFHFGSKQDLYNAVEEYVLAEARTKLAESMSAVAVGRLERLIKQRSVTSIEDREVLSFIRRALIDPHQGSVNLVQEIYVSVLAVVEEYNKNGQLKSGLKEKATALAILCLQLGPLVFGGRLGAESGCQLGSSAALIALARVNIEMIGSVIKLDQVEASE